jgi:hypothetical protein
MPTLAAAAVVAAATIHHHRRPSLSPPRANYTTSHTRTHLHSQDVYKTGDQIKAAGGKVTRDPGPVPGIGTKILACTDPDGYKIVFVDNEDFLKELEQK